jgi:hypothetical protein
VTRLVLALLTAVLVLAPPAGAATRGLTLGFFDTDAFAGPEGGAWLDRARLQGGEMVRLSVNWRGITARRPAAPTDPADPAYRFEETDRQVSEALARGMTVLLSIEGAPDWAEEGRRPAGVTPGSYRPDAQALGAFAEAVARRYAGRVRDIQLWNEPNLSKYLAPQWVRQRGRTVAFAPVRYRAMLNAAFAGIRRGSPGARLVTAGTAPFGDLQPGGRRTMPVRFWREVLRGRVSFDTLSHHPYGVGSPRQEAVNRDDASVPDMHKLTALVRRAVRRGTLLPRTGRQTWVTEMSWDSSPPDPDGVPAARHAAWLADSLFVLWKQGVDTVAWFQIRDQAPVPSYAATNQSGIYLRDGRPKLSARAYRFPFACERAGRGRVRVWTKAPAAGPVEVLDGDRVVARLQAPTSRVVTARLRGSAGLRGRAAGLTSLPCQVL